MDWIWKKGVSVGKKILAAACVVISAPFVVPPLVVASTVALISSLPYCFLLVCYVCTEKLMRILLPATSSGRRSDKTMLLPKKIGHGYIYDDQGIARVAEGEGIAAIAFREEERSPLRVTNIEDEGMRKESKSLLESIRDEDRTNQSLYRGIYEKGFEEEDKELILRSDAKSQNHGAGKKQVSATRRHEESTRTKASQSKDMEKSSNEMKVLYSEEQIWAKIEALRKVVGYSVARSTAYSEELKALYMFMGVELPTSMLEKENQDIAQVCERLYFLMSVIGIK